MLLNPDLVFDLEHRAYFGSKALPGATIFFAASTEGRVSAIDFTKKAVKDIPLAKRLSNAVRPPSNEPDVPYIDEKTGLTIIPSLPGITTNQCRLTPQKIDGICFHHSQPLIAWVETECGSVVVQALTGQTVTEILPPPLAAHSSRWVTQGFTDCYFDETDDFLWLAAPLSDNEAELLLIETKNWKIVQKAAVEDPFGSSHWSFHSTGRPGVISVWAAAGQDGQQIYWLTRDSSNFSLQKADELVDCIPPVFSPDGSEFLIVARDSSIRRYTFENMEQRGPSLFSPDEDNPFEGYLLYLHGRRALAKTLHARLYVVDLERMSIEDEVAIEGHEPRPTCEYYPILAEDRTLVTDISWFTKVGNVVVFVYRRDEGSGLNGWKDSLLCHSLCSAQGQV